MKKNIAAFLGLLSLVIFCFACGGQVEKSKSESGTDMKQVTQEKKKAEPATTQTPEELGKAIAAVYVDAMKKVIEMGKEHPPAEELKPKLIEYKEECIAKLVAFGKTKQGFTDEQKAKVNSQLRMASREVNSMFTDYSNVINPYLNEDKETYDLLASFNVITQYADFDLLKKQEPEEAMRLGIE